MAKRFKLRICRVIATTLQTCRSKDPSSLPTDPVPSFPHLSKFSSLHRSAANHHAFISIGCNLPSAAADDPPQFKWQKEEKWHVVANIHHTHRPRSDAAADDLVFAQPSPPAPPPPEKSRRRSKKKKQRNIPSRLRLSTSSADSGWFSSEGGGAAADEETETLVSSSPGSSSELHPIRETQAFPAANQPQRRSRRPRPSSSSRTKRGIVRAPAAAAETETPARLSMFKKLIPCTVDGKVKESFAIVKRSSDPYEDFRKSMMDMIVEKQMFERKDLEQLLQCFLSLNSRNYHGIIVQAFSEIWAAMFSPAAGHDRRRVASFQSI